MSSLKKISLKDIAEAAGVSTALVSFVLNGKKKEYRVGGGYRMDGATVMILQKKGKEMTLRVLNAKGETLKELNL